MPRSFVFLHRTALAALLALSGHAPEAATLRVPSQYPTIQGAIDASRTGDTVLVAPGIYFEGLAIRDKGILTLESEAGAESTIIDGTGATNVIEVSASKNSHATDYRISGFTIRHGDHGGINGDRGQTHVENNIIIDNALVDGYSYGAVRLRFGGGSIKHNVIKGNHTTAVWLAYPRQVVVEDNFLDGNVEGIEVLTDSRPGASIKVIRNVVKDTLYRAFHTYGQVYLQAADNLFIRNVDYSVDSSVLLVGGDTDFGGDMTGKFVNNTSVALRGSAPLVSLSGDLRRFEFANNIMYTANDATALSCWTWALPTIHHNDAFSAHGKFVDPECGDFSHERGNVLVEPGFTLDSWQLDPGSPLIDAGSNQPIKHLPRDLRGAPRIVDGGHGPVVDMGAYEYQSK